MNAVQDLAEELESIQDSQTVELVHVIERGRQVIKARVYLSGGLFVQVYRNDRFGTTSFALILGGRRIYGRDEQGGSWHRHPPEDPENHDESEEGRRAVTLKEFWIEALGIVSSLGLL